MVRDECEDVRRGQVPTTMPFRAKDLRCWFGAAVGRGVRTHRRRSLKLHATLGASRRLKLQRGTADGRYRAADVAAVLQPAARGGGGAAKCREGAASVQAAGGRCKRRAVGGVAAVSCRVLKLARLRFATVLDAVQPKEIFRLLGLTARGLGAGLGFHRLQP